MLRYHRPFVLGMHLFFMMQSGSSCKKNKKNRIVNQGRRFQLVRLRRGSYVWILCLKARSLRERLRDALSLPPQLL